MNSDEKLIAPLPTLRELIVECERADAMRRQCGIPHPLHKFALNGAVKDCPQADMVMDCIDAEALEKPYSIRWLSARWFLLQSNMLFEACEIAGIDARKLRRHLHRIFRVLDHQRMRAR